jgi:hypothetical protein
VVINYILFRPFRALTSYSVPQSFFIDGRAPWTSDQPVARPLPKHMTTQTQNKRTHTHTHTHNIHALSWIRTHDLSVRASEDSSYLRPRGHCYRLILGLEDRKLETHFLILLSASRQQVNSKTGLDVFHIM